MDTERIKQLMRLPLGERTNAVLYDLLQSRFFGYWAFREPKHAGIELADSLVWWHDVVLLFEAKTRTKPGAAPEAWIRSKLGDSIASINDRARLLREGKVDKLRNAWRGEVAWSPQTKTWYYGVVVLNHESEPYDPREIAPGAFSGSEIPIQVFSLFDLAELLRFISTTWVFIVYYEMRNLFGQTFRLDVHREFETYQGVLSQWVKYAKALSNRSLSDSEFQEDRDFQIRLTKALLNADNARESAYREVAASFLIDLAIGSIERKADPDTTGKRVGSDRHTFYVDAMEILAGMSRRRRAFYGLRWLEAAEESNT